MCEKVLSLLGNEANVKGNHNDAHDTRTRLEKLRKH